VSYRTHIANLGSCQIFQVKAQSLNLSYVSDLELAQWLVVIDDMDGMERFVLADLAHYQGEELVRLMNRVKGRLT